MTEIPLKFLSRTVAAQRVRNLHGIPCEPSTLAKRATTGTGPTYRIIGGKAMYLDADVDSWASSLVSEPLRKASDAPIIATNKPQQGSVG
jgi:hypothetical protein